MSEQSPVHDPEAGQKALTSTGPMFFTLGPRSQKLARCPSLVEKCCFDNGVHRVEARAVAEAVGCQCEGITRHGEDFRGIFQNLAVHT